MSHTVFITSNKTKTTTLVILIATLLMFISPAYGSDYRIGYVVGDGAHGRVFKKWTQSVPNFPISSVKITLRKQSGGNDAYVNLRFQGGQTFENGKRIYLKDTGTKTVSWNVNMQTAKGKPLVLNAYNCEVYMESASVNYQNSVSTPNIRPNPSVPTIPSTTQVNPSTVNDDPGAISRCRYARIKRPRIDLGRLRPTGGLFSAKYKAEGSIRGMCIEEAGYFEYGRLKEEINFPLTDRFERQDFNFKVRTGRKGEIRVSTTNGKEDIIVIDDEIKSQGMQR